MTDSRLIGLLEDDEDQSRLLEAWLTQAGYTVRCYCGASEFRRRQGSASIDLLILDWNLPEESGLSVLRALRDAGSPLPVLVLTARNAEADIVAGLREGADDYVVKPVAPAVLEARLRAVLRRGLRVTEPDRLSLGDLVIDQSAMRVYVAGSDLDLSATEFRLLSTLVSERGHALSRGQLIDAVWADSLPSTARVVDTTIQRVRAKLAAAGVTSPVLETLRGIGYLVR